MRLCRDCKYFSDARYINDDEGRLGWSPQWCSRKIGPIDPVSGNQERVGDPMHARADEEKCGNEGRWFEAGTLDGKLALLYEKIDNGEENGPSATGATLGELGTSTKVFGIFRRSRKQR